MNEIVDLGLQTNADVLKRFIDINGKRVIDAGCGSLTFSKILAEAGGRVLAIDPDVEQAKVNRSTDLSEWQGRIEFIESGADSIPVPNHTFDAIFFSYSLHHIPSRLFESVFTEADRVLKTNEKVHLYIIEPIDCPFNSVMKLFHNEDQERSEAWNAIFANAAPRFTDVVAVEYHSLVTYESVDHFIDRFANRSFNPGYTRADVESDSVRQAFFDHANPTDAGYEFVSPKRAVCLTR